MIAKLDTTQRLVSFYVSWFFKLFQITEAGWQQIKTPDDKPIMDQDAFFQQALDHIGRKLNENIAHERWKAAQGS